MPAPADPQKFTRTEAAPGASASGDADETRTAPYTGDTDAAPAFGPPVEPGEVGRLGPYRIVKELGHGGMGAVYAALDTRLDRRLALKVMLPKYAASPAAKERFLREARAAAKISHDNVVTVYEADERDGVPYIAMQFLEGYPLDEYLRRKGNPSIPQVLRIARETAAGLAAAHRIGLVHRDIKPGNLWLEAPNGRIKVLDFGLAKPVDAEVELTKSGAVVGTPAYMSPEQARAEKVDHRTDLFSLGAVLYRLCTGKLPFEGSTTMAVLMALGTKEPTPVREVNPAVPDPLAALIHQLLAKNAAARPQSADEVMKRVRGLAEELAPPLASAVSVEPQVVYVPIQVTALPSEANPFADIDTSATEHIAAGSPAVPQAAPKPVRRKPEGKSPWLIAGGALALAALVVGGVIIIIKNKDGKETKIEVPDGSTVTVGKDGKTVVVQPPGVTPAAEMTPDRKAAEYVLSVGGVVRVNGEDRDIKAVANLPNGHFSLTMVNLNGNKKLTDVGLTNLQDCKNLMYLDLQWANITDAGLANFKECKSLTELSLASTTVSDVGLARFKDCKGLTFLRLDQTAVTDAGLAHFKDCKGLAHVSLYLTNVSDAGLEYFRVCKGLTFLHLGSTNVTDNGLSHLKVCKNLTFLYVEKAKVTAKGLADFHAAVPGCRIVHDGGIIPAEEVDRKAAEWVIAQGGWVRINGKGHDIKAGADLPKERFALTGVSFFGAKVSDAELAQLKEFTNLTELFLRGTKVTDSGLEHLKELRGLTVLNLGSTQVSDAGLAHLKELTNLTQLLLISTKVTDAGLAHLKELKALTRLNVQKTAVTPKGLADFHAAVPGCKIEHDGGTFEAEDPDRKAAEYVLSVGGNGNVNVNGEVRGIKPELPKERFSLTSVNLAGNKLLTEAGLAVFDGCKEVKELNLHNSAVTDAGLAHFKNCKGLKSFTPSATKVTDAGLAHFKDFTEVTHLSLYGTLLTDAGLACFKDCKSLTVLELHSTALTDEGLVHFKDCKNLTRIELGYTKVTDAGLVNFKDCKGLLTLDVKGTKVTAKGLADFHAAVPGCKIEHDGGTLGPKK